MEEQNRCELEMDLSQTNQNERPAGSWLCCLPCYWLKRNSGFHKISLSLATLLVTVLLVASPVLFLISSLPGEKSKDCAFEGLGCEGKENVKLCLTEECSKAGTRILSSMLWAANPCQDFYRFACGSRDKDSNRMQGRYQGDHLIDAISMRRQVERNLKSLLTVNANSDPLQKLGIFYKSCIVAEGKRTSLLPMLEELGGYVAPKEDPPEDLTNLVLNMLRLNGAPLFDVYLDSDLDNSSKLAPFIDLPPPGFGFDLALKSWGHRKQNYIPGKFFLAKKNLSEAFSSKRKEGSERYNNAFNFMKASIEEKRLLVMEKIMLNFMSGNVSHETVTKEFQSTLLFASVIRRLFPGRMEIIKNRQREPNVKMTAGELERNFPFIRWQYLFDEFFNLKISSQDQVVVLVPDYIESLQRILHRFSSRVIHNGLLLIFATDTLYEIVNTSSTRDWSSFCNKMTVKTFGQAVSILYVRQFEQEYIEKLRLRVTDIFNVLKTTLNERMKKTSWLDEKTKKAILEKLADLRIQFLSRSAYWNASYTSSLMQNVQVHPEDFFGNVIRRYRQMRKVPVVLESQEKGWTYPFVINAFYALPLNAIILPLALLIQPYFKEELPLYMPYSTIGLIIAHEILHGFDLERIDHDSKGNIGINMSQGSRAKFEARIDCFVKQFSASFRKKVHFLETNVDLQFDWNMTKNENLADVDGLNIAYQAWQKMRGSESELHLPGVSLNPRQLFFLNAAQTYCTVLSPTDYIFLVEVDFHTPQSERVNGMMMNSPGFAEAYNCPLGSPMNPRKKCFTL